MWRSAIARHRTSLKTSLEVCTVALCRLAARSARRLAIIAGKNRMQALSSAGSHSIVTKIARLCFDSSVNRYEATRSESRVGAGSKRMRVLRTTLLKPLIPQQYLAGVGHAGPGFAASLASLAAYLEQVGEIIAETDRQMDDERSIAVILHSESLIGGRLPEKRGTDDVKRVLFQNDPLVLVDIRIGQIDAGHRIVVADARAHQQRRHSLHP